MVKLDKDHVTVLIYLRTKEKDSLLKLAEEYGLSLSRFVVLSSLGKLKVKKGGDLD